jgi:hypothetical protein
MPATWLAWSLIFFIVCLISFIWRAGAIEDKQDRGLSRDQALLPRIIASSVFGIGFVYLILIISTLRRYGSMMDQKWKARVKSWLETTGSNYMGSWVHPVPSIAPFLAPQYTSGSSSFGNTWAQPVPSMTPYPTAYPTAYPTGVSPTIIMGQPSPNFSNPMPLGNAWQWRWPEPVTIPASPAHSLRPHSTASSLKDQPQPRQPNWRVGVKRSMPRHVDRDSVQAEGVSSPSARKVKMVKLVDLSVDQGTNFSPVYEELASCQISMDEVTELNAVSLNSYSFSLRTSERRCVGHLQVLGS